MENSFRSFRCQLSPLCECCTSWLVLLVMMLTFGRFMPWSAVVIIGTWTSWSSAEAWRMQWMRWQSEAVWWSQMLSRPELSKPPVRKKVEMCHRGWGSHGVQTFIIRSWRSWPCCRQRSMMPSWSLRGTRRSAARSCRSWRRCRGSSTCSIITPHQRSKSSSEHVMQGRGCWNLILQQCFFSLIGKNPDATAKW